MIPGEGPKVALLDSGRQENIASSLNERGCEVTVYPADTPAQEIIASKPDGIMLSNGPGDPKECTGVIREIKKLYDTDIPIFAICLGHQLMALATGADTHKMKYGHRGGNHPVKDLATGRVYISSRTMATWWMHGYAEEPKVAHARFCKRQRRNQRGVRHITGRKYLRRAVPSGGMPRDLGIPVCLFEPFHEDDGR